MNQLTPRENIHVFMQTLENVYIIGADGKEHKLPKKKF